MEHADYVAVLRSHGSALAAAARTVPLDAPVPSCPAWTMHDLVGHLAIHHRWVAANLDRSPEEGMFAFADLEPAPARRESIAWLEAGVEMLASKLETIGPARPCWTWADQPVTGFWARRTAHETVVHGWDGRNAASRHAGALPDPIEADVAADAVDEYLSLVPLRFWAETPHGNGEAIQIRCLDAPAQWLVSLDTDGMRVTRETGRNDVEVSGDASDVLLALMGRAPTDAVEVTGAVEVLERWREQARF